VTVTNPRRLAVTVVAVVMGIAVGYVTVELMLGGIGELFAGNAERGAVSLGFGLAIAALITLLIVRWRRLSSRTVRSSSSAHGKTSQPKE